MLRASRIGLGAAIVLLAAGFAVHAAAAAAAAVVGTNALDHYLNGLNSLSAAFTQTVLNGEGTQTETGSGRLLVQRPGKFRWEYQPKEAGGTAGNEARGQVLVADGSNLWFYDRELAQVTVKPVASALSATPIMLLSGSAAQLHESFEISAGTPHDGLDWVDVKPRSAEADFAGAQLGFSSDKLARMIVRDRLGQTVQLDFSHSERNARIDAAALKFQPPKGVDVIGAPQG